MTVFPRQGDNFAALADLPAWLPDAVRLYLDHTEAGVSLRALARREGCHASTVMRQVRRYENRRDDPLIDEALSRLARVRTATRPDIEEHTDMTAPLRTPPSRRAQSPVCDEATILNEARRVLRRLCEAGAVLAIAPGLDKAAVLKSQSDETSVRTAVLDRTVAEAFALKDWIACARGGRVATYTITSAGRAALRRMIDAEARTSAGFAEAAAPFADQHRDWGTREVAEGCGATRLLRVNIAESPVATLARRKDKDGKAFLGPELVLAAERLREDFELAQLGPRVAQNWDRFLTGGDRGTPVGGGPAEGPRAARDRVASALRDLGPGLGDMALRCCCYLEGLETAERRLGWSARSGKIVLRIALIRLKRHYDEVHGGAPLIG